jgi:CheY-like chemotaxis protein
MSILLAQAIAQDKEPAKNVDAERDQAFRKAEDNYRRFFKRPDTTLEFWEAIRFEIDVGRYDLAAQLLKDMMARKPADKELLEIEAKYGISAFLRLLTIPQLSKEAAPLVEQVNTAMKTLLGDPERIKKFIARLSATPEERIYAIRELQRSGAAAIPLMIEAVRSPDAKPNEQMAILTALPRLNKVTLPPLLAALEINDPVFRSQLIQVLQHRGDKDAVPYLWYYSAAPDQPEYVRQYAKTALAALLGTEPSKLMNAKVALAREADRYYRHEVKFIDPRAVAVWRWDGKALTSENLPANKAEETYGLHFARQALALDPAYEPAQTVFLGLALEKVIDDIGVDQPLAKAPRIRELVATINPDLLSAVLDRALAENRRGVILGAIRALGESGDVRAARAVAKTAPPLVRALNYPDRRVRMAAADALLRIPGTPTPPVSVRIVEVLSHELLADPIPKALIADLNKDRADIVAKFVKEAGFEPVVVATGRDAIRRLKQASDIDIILLDHGIAQPELPYTLAQMRADRDIAMIPVVITALPAQIDFEVSPLVEITLRRMAERYRNVYVLPVPGPNALKAELPRRIAEALGKPMTEAERKDYPAEAIRWLKRMATGEVPGYDIRPAEAAILKALRNEELANLAIEAAGRLPGREGQRELAAVVLNAERPPQQRIKAAEELVRSLQQHGLVLATAQIKALQALFQTTNDANLKTQVALVMGAMRPGARRTGELLQGYRPAAGPAAEPAPQPKEQVPDKEKEKEKEKEPEKKDADKEK